MTDTIFGVIAQEEGQVATVEVEFDGGVAIEEAIVAIEEADKVEDIMFAADTYADKVEAIAAFEEGILAEPEQVTAATAKMAAATTVVLAKEQGFPTTVSMEDDVTDPVRGLTVAIEEKRNIAKRVYDSVVVFFKKFVNMIKKAFAKVVMTISGTDKYLKKLSENLKKAKDKVAAEKVIIESLFQNKPVYQQEGKPINTMLKMAEEAFDKGGIIEAMPTMLIDVAQKITVDDAKGPMSKVFNKVYDKAEKIIEKNNMNKNVELTAVSYTGKYVRCIVSGEKEEGKPVVKIEKIVPENAPLPNEEIIDAKYFASVVNKAIKANSEIKKFTDASFKTANDALNKASELSKKSDEGDASITKLKIDLIKAGGSLGYGIAMDRFKIIRELSAFGKSTKL